MKKKILTIFDLVCMHILFKVHIDSSCDLEDLIRWFHQKLADLDLHCFKKGIDFQNPMDSAFLDWIQ